MPPVPVQELNARRTTVEQIVNVWPTDQPLVMLHSANQHEQWGRWSVLAMPDSFEQINTSQDNAMDRLRRLLTRNTASTCSHGSPFSGGWIGYLSYELGCEIEPAASCKTRTSSGPWPLVELAYCPGALVFDHHEQHWACVGCTDAAESILSLLDWSRTDHSAMWTASALKSARPGDAHLNAVTQTLHYIAAGDIFQANMTQQFHADFTGSTRALACNALSQSGARYGAYLEMPNGRCVVSMSPELFLQFTPCTREVVTRPIKGTRPQRDDVNTLLHSAKDEAELNMIIDLMRNDLGRVCEYNTVHVAQARQIETHPTVHHGVGTVIGRLNATSDIADLLMATFPGGSITGAPKIRAMQIIEELEQSPRGPYCGAIGMFSDCGSMTLSIAIRTMLLRGLRESSTVWDRLDGQLTYGAGGGIVADSLPLAEYRESLDKLAVLRLALRGATCASHA